MTKNLPYIEIIFDKLNSNDRDTCIAFDEYIHWGLWRKNQNINSKEYHKAQQELTKLFFKYINIKENSKILDVGCGNGGAIKLLNSSLNNVELNGINNDKQQIDHAKRQINPKNNNRILFQEMDAKSMLFEESYFDVVYALESIFHFENRSAFIKDVSRIIKSGGRFALTDFVPVFPINHILTLLENVFHLVKRTYGPVNLNICMRKYRKIFEQNGFTIETVLDITQETIPTYQFINNKLDKLDKSKSRNFKRVNGVMEVLSRLKLIRYKVFVLKLESNRSMLISGASTGIGRHLTELFAHRGWIVFAGCRREEDMKKLKAVSNNVVPLLLDVTKDHDIQIAKKTISESATSFSAVINNAGVGLGGPIEEIPVSKFKDVFDVNFFGSISIAQTFLPLLRKTHGRLINIGSIAGFVSVPFMQPYSTSKFALRALSKGLSIELENHSVNVSLIEAGPYRTPIWEKSIDQSLNSNLHLGSYVNEMKVFERTVKHLEKYQADLKHLNKKIIHALESTKPKSNYLVYKYRIFDVIIFKVIFKYFAALIFKKILRCRCTKN